MASSTWERLARCLDLGAVLAELRAEHGGYELLFHHTQGEFHHDVGVRAASAQHLPAPVLVIATNCNGGVKELLAFDAEPTPAALWHRRCPESPEFGGALPALRAESRTHHWFEPCELLEDSARSELRPEWRERQPGGGWRMRSCAVPGQSGASEDDDRR
jgi:hypothetical protein